MCVRELVLLLAFGTQVCKCTISDFAECHEDYELDPPDGVLQQRNSFTWLGFIQYLHETLGIQHFTLAPRVVLVQKQYVLATTKDVFNVPKQYKLGSIIFGQYERDEEDCKLKLSQAKMGITCGPAYIETPFSKIIPNPEYTRFGAKTSLALIKLIRPLKSLFMVPICLPTYTQRTNLRKQRSVLMIDYLSASPTDFDEEKMGKKTLTLYTERDCRRRRGMMGSTTDEVTFVLCTSGCAIRQGAPIVAHVATGAFELMGLAFSSSPCFNRDMRTQLNDDPPLFIDVYPYVNWIIGVITANVIPHPYPHLVKLTNSGSEVERRRYTGGALRSKLPQKEKWLKRTYVVGNKCFTTRSQQRKELYFFYSERFEAYSGLDTRLTVYLKISAGIECAISCVRILLPNRMTVPKIAGVGGYNISIEFKTKWFPEYFHYAVILSGMNTSAEDLQMYKAELPNNDW